MSILKQVLNWLTGADPVGTAASEPEQRVNENEQPSHPFVLPESLPMTAEEIQLVALFAALLAGQDESGKELHLYEMKRVA